MASTTTSTATERSSSSSNSNIDVVYVLGGGIAGLAAAAALRKIANIDKVYVIERSSAADFYDNDNTGANAKVGPNGLRALRAISPDAVDTILQEGSVHKAVAMLSGREGEEEVTTTVIPDCTITDTGLPQILIRWGKLRETLQSLIPKEQIYTGLGHDVCGYSVQEENGTVQLINDRGEVIGPSDEVPAPSLIVAADGVHSPFQSLVRTKSTLLTGPDAPAIRRSNVHDNGRVNINAVVHQPLEMADGQETEEGTALAFSSPDKSTACFFSTVSKAGHTAWAISVADAVDETGSILKFFEKSSKDTLPETKAFLLERLAEMDAPTFALNLVKATDASRLFVRRSLQLTLVGPTFVSFDSKVVLCGDAAHAMSPSYGQGSNFALEDAVTLALAIKHHADNLPEALRLYSDLRVDRCEEMFRRSAERVKKQLRGEKAANVPQWIGSWDVPQL